MDLLRISHRETPVDEHRADYLFEEIPLPVFQDLIQWKIEVEVCPHAVAKALAFFTFSCGSASVLVKQESVHKFGGFAFFFGLTVGTIRAVLSMCQLLRGATGLAVRTAR